MHWNALRIMKLDPNNNDAMSSIGDDLGYGEYKYSRTVVGIDGCVYGIPWNFKCIVKCDPINDITLFVGEKADDDFEVRSDGALGRDGFIYAITYDDRILKTDTNNNVHYFVGNSIDSIRTIMVIKIGVMLYWELMVASIGCEVVPDLS